jgi:ribose 5-phosphate isomerase B
MKIAIAADHAGYAAKEEIKAVIKSMGHEVLDQGTNSDASVDYPDYAEKVARAVVGGKADRGVLICGTGIGMSIAANKVDGIRAALITDEKTADLSRRHNDANVFCAGSRITSVVKIAECLKVWLQTEFEGGRHVVRVGKIAGLEKQATGAGPG